SNGCKSVRTCGPCGTGDNLERNQLVRLALDNLVVAIDAPATWPFQALLEHCTHTQWFARYLLNIDHSRSPMWAVHSIQNEIEYGFHWPINCDAFFRVSHDVSPFLKTMLAYSRRAITWVCPSHHDHQGSAIPH